MNTSNCLECRECYEVAIAVEVGLRRFYLRLAELFEDQSEIADAFLVLAHDEEEHAEILEILKSRKSHPPTAHLNSQQNALVLLGLLGRIGIHISQSFKNFDEAWELALSLENSEINKIYLGLTSQALKANEKDKLDTVEILKTHVDRLTHLGRRFDKQERISIFPKLI